ncbi:unnamed protein product [Mortierella alpina]
MKLALLAAAVIAVGSKVSAYVCPSFQDVAYSCKQLNVFPLVCYNPKLFVEQCNEKQCNQPYIDNYAACQCRRSTTDFYEHAKNVGGLIRRCGGNNLTNPFGDPNQYRPGQGTATFSATGTASGTASGTAFTASGTTSGTNSGTTSGTTSGTASGTTSGFVTLSGNPSGTPFPFPVVPIPRNPGDNATRIFNGTTYYGGQTTNISGTTRIVNATAIVNGTTIVSGTTTWVSGTPGIIGGTSTPSAPPTQFVSGRTGTTAVVTRTALPIAAPVDEPLNVNTQSTHISGGAIAGIVLGLLGAALLAGLLALCWRKKRAAHVAPAGTTHISHAPTRTVVTEKIEPVVVKSVPANQTAHGALVPDANAASSSYVASTGGYNTQPRR